MNYNDAISYLYGLQKFGIKLGVDNTTRLLSILGEPHNEFRTIHVAGTNGKGSTSAMIASMLQAHGYRVGLFTSPHLVSFTERIRINNREIKESEVINLTSEIKALIEILGTDISPTFFEFVTVMAFLYFSRKNVDWAVIETGMGGRLDSTNVITPAATVITKIGLDHREFLGSTLRAIAIEKAGIIKEGIPVITSSQEKDALEVIVSRAAEMDSDIHIYGRNFRSFLKKMDMEGIEFDYYGKESFKNLYTPLTGNHQLENASVSIRTVETVLGIDINVSSIKRGLSNVRWPGRLELIKRQTEPFDILLDGAHNPPASEALRDALSMCYKERYDRIILILGIMADKEIKGIMAPILPLSSYTIFTAPDYNRAASPEMLLYIALKDGYAGESCPTIKESITKAISLASTHPGRTLIVITGSFYTIGEALEHLGRKGILTRLRESR
ncbi:MAG: bifunctional folylpolyglutamate synthase/dihydrofolate synthase [Thermodesulfovibrionales bacterium]